MGADGISAVLDPSGLFVERHHAQVPGTCVAVTMEGRRPLLAEVQALVTQTGTERPRRTTSGLDSSRVAMVAAVLQQHCHVPLHQFDLLASTVGGARIGEPASDLAVAIAITSASCGVPTPRGVVAMGEIGLSGELRRVRDLPQRLAEAARQGFQLAVVPADPARSGPRSPESWTVDGMRVVDVTDIGSALRMLQVLPRREGRPRPVEVL
jgi:DNA repair protein RadA/Sms